MASQKQLLDILLAEHPPGAIKGFGETALRFFLNDAVALFCEESSLWRDRLTVTTTAGTTAYDLTDQTVNLLRVTIPSLGEHRVIPELKTPIEAVVSSGTSSSAAAAVVYYVRPSGTALNGATTGGYQLHIGRLSNGALTALDAGTVVEVWRAARPDALSDSTILYDSAGEIVTDSGGNPVYVSSSMNDVLALPTAFHLAPVHYASQKLWMLRQDRSMPERLAMEKHHKEHYFRLLKQARAYGERGLTRGVHPKPIYF